MRKFLVLCCSFVFVSSVFADFKQNQIVKTSTQILQIFNQDFNGSNKNYQLPKRFSKDRIKAVLVVPDLVKSGIIGSTQSGLGIFMLKLDKDTWSTPLFVKVFGLGIGLQAGYQSTDAILLFDNTRSFSGILDNGETLDLGADIAVFGGRSTHHVTDTPRIAANVLAIGRSNGVFGGGSLNISKFTVSEQDNIDYFGRIYKYEDILNNSPKASKYTKQLQKVLQYTFDVSK